MSGSPYIFDAGPDSFARLVLENSHKGPVLVNYWSPRAGPCLKLWPLLEKLAGDYAGRFLLVNLNTDNYNALARDYGVNSVPTVKVFRNGEVAETVHGAESEARFRSLIEKYVARPSDVSLAQAIGRFERGEADAALSAITEIAAGDPGNPRVPIAHAKLLFRVGRYAEVVKLLDALPPDRKRIPEISTLLVHAGFFLVAQQAPDIETLQRRVDDDPADLAARYQLAAVHLLADHYESAMAQLLEIAGRDRGFLDDVGRKGLITIFGMLGDGHPLTRRFREELVAVIR